VIAGVDRRRIWSSQLLTLARVDAANQGNAPQPLEPAGIIAEVCADLPTAGAASGATLVVDAARVARSR